MSARWPAGWRGGTGGRSLSRPGAAARIRRSGDPAASAVMGLPADLVFRTKGQLAIGLCADAFADGVWFDFVCGDEVYGNSTELREFCEDRGQGYVLRVRSTFHLVLAGGGEAVTCAQAARALGKNTRRWEIRSAGAGSKGQPLADRPPPEAGGAGLPLLFGPKGPAREQGRADPRGGAALASRKRFRVRQGLLRPGPAPGPPLPRDRPPHRPGHGRAGGVCRHRRLTARPHRYPGTSTGQARSAASRRPPHDPADRPGDQAPARPPRQSRPAPPPPPLPEPPTPPPAPPPLLP